MCVFLFFFAFEYEGIIEVEWELNSFQFANSSYNKNIINEDTMIYIRIRWEREKLLFLYWGKYLIKILSYIFEAFEGKTFSMPSC